MSQLVGREKSEEKEYEGRLEERDLIHYNDFKQRLRNGYRTGTEWVQNIIFSKLPVSGGFIQGIPVCAASLLRC